MAYHAIGKAMYKAERYEEAMQYFKLARTRGDYSQAFKEYRKELMREHFEWILVGVVVLFILIRYVLPPLVRKLRARIGSSGTNSRPHAGNQAIVKEGEAG
jgi:hypothetical protein